jgi:hypothetical protein
MTDSPKYLKAEDVLAPCPFCGGSAEARSLGGDQQNWACGCWSETCGVSPIAELDYADADGPASYRSRDEAIAAWNTRAPFPASPGVEVERRAIAEAWAVKFLEHNPGLVCSIECMTGWFHSAINQALDDARIIPISRRNSPPCRLGQNARLILTEPE